MNHQSDNQNAINQNCTRNFINQNNSQANYEQKQESTMITEGEFDDKDKKLKMLKYGKKIKKKLKK